MTFTLGVFDGSQLVPSPKRTHRTPESWWIIFDAAGRPRYGQGDAPEGTLPAGPFKTKYAAMKYVKELP